MEYEIKGTPLPVVICQLNRGESLICDSGAMAWMDPCMEMETTSGGLGKTFGRLFSSETIFQNRYHANDNGKIAFASSFPGKIIPYQLESSKEIIVQKSSFLACEQGVDMSVFFNQKMSSGFFGGEGFTMTKLAGNGIAFLEIDGDTVEYDLAPGQQIIADTGYVAMMDATCKMEIKTVPGIKNKFLGGEGIFNTVITGPGKVVLQTMPISTLANNIVRFIPTGR